MGSSLHSKPYTTVGRHFVFANAAVSVSRAQMTHFRVRENVKRSNKVRAEIVKLKLFAQMLTILSIFGVVWVSVRVERRRKNPTNMNAKVRVRKWCV